MVKFGEIAREVRTVWKEMREGVPVVGLEHIVPGEMELKKYDLPEENTFTKKFCKGQVLFGRRRAYQKKATVATFDGICSGDITVIEPIPGMVVPELLPFIVANDRFFDHAIQGSAGSLSPRVKWEHMANYEFELPTLGEQKVLSNKLWAAYRLKEAYQRLLNATDEMEKSQFLEMFGEEAKWKIMPLKDIVHVDCPISYGIVQPGDDLEDGISIVRPVDMTSDLYIGKDGLKKTSKAISESYRRTILRGDEILLCVRGTTGLVNLAKSELAGCNVTRGITPLYFKDNINPRYVYCVLTSPKAQQYIADHTHGSTLKGINMEDVRNLPIPIPSLEVQNQCESILIQADKSKFDGFKSQFLEMFGNAKRTPLVDVCLKSGEYGSNSPADDYDGNIRYVRITDITDEGNLNNLLVSPRKIEEKYLLVKDDLLFARTGNTVGKTYLHNEGKMVFAGYLIRYKLNKNIVLPQFAFAYTHTNDYYVWVEKTKKIGAQPNISATQYDEMPIPTPPLSEQKAFVSIAEQADKSKFELRKAISAIDEVIKSLING